ncbi:hypothetical protein EVAR_100011_1 [Eumeta japonica]|uniref:Uncharacterized protein n=1 Tax=Eumeta variegata TaxID=151549 RepID=A0A4C1ZSC5_EUMVA|nr:hypothetical protein EVAR_100011_1 [Eumeta japonica]
MALAVRGLREVDSRSANQHLVGLLSESGGCRALNALFPNQKVLSSNADELPDEFYDSSQTKPLVRVTESSPKVVAAHCWQTSTTVTNSCRANVEGCRATILRRNEKDYVKA